MFKKENYLMLVLVIGFGIFNTNLIAQDDAEDDVEEVVVTGSRIATSEFTGAQPVVVIDAEDIAATGELTGCGDVFSIDHNNWLCASKFRSSNTRSSNNNLFYIILCVVLSNQIGIKYTETDH